MKVPVRKAGPLPAVGAVAPAATAGAWAKEAVVLPARQLPTPSITLLVMPFVF
ncbi:MAG: hypothetical protein WKG07_21995 [Hymenobacter sp.]